MAANMPVKLLLRDTSSISLNERFEKLPKRQPQESQQRNSGRQQQHNGNRQQHQASAKNRRLALQMANRPSVQMVLGTSQGVTSPTGPSRRGNLRGRGAGRGRGGHRGRGGALGANNRNAAPGSQGGTFHSQNRMQNNVKSRLTLRGGARGGGATAATSSVKERLGMRSEQGATAIGRGAAVAGRGGAANRRGRGRGGLRGQSSPRGGGDSRRGAFNRNFDLNTRSGLARGAMARGGSMRGRGGTLRGRGASRGRGGQRVFTNSQRGAESRGGRGGNRGANRGRRGRGGQANKSSLDNELDEYMAAANIDDELLM